MGVTPDEADLPLIISVDDHVMEPKDLWQRELPESMRERGPKVVTEQIKLEFTGGHYGFSRNDPDGTWCDLWIFDDLVVPTGLLHAPAGMPRDEQRNVPATYDDFRKGTWDQTERLADMTLNHVEAAINFPNVFPRFAGQGFLEREDKDLALACLRIYNDWMIDEWSGGAGQRSPDPAHPRSPVGPGAGRRGGPALRGQGQLRRGLHREPVQARPAVHVHGGVGRPLVDLRGDREHRVDAHRLVVVDADHLAGRAAGHLDVALRPERPGLAGRLGLLRDPGAPPAT